jgi:hypothetical protein
MKRQTFKHIQFYVDGGVFGQDIPLDVTFTWYAGCDETLTTPEEPPTIEIEEVIAVFGKYMTLDMTGHVALEEDLSPKVWEYLSDYDEQ